MASCALTQGIGRPPCPGATPGAFDTFYLFNTDDVSAYVAGTGPAVSDVTFKVGKGFYQVIATKKSVIAKESLVDDDSSGTSYTPEVSFNLADVSQEARDFVNGLNGPEMGVLVQSKTGDWLLFGYTEGLQMKVNDFTTESGDGFGEGVTLRASDVNEKRRTFFDTDAGTTLTNITSKIVGS